MSFVLYYFQVEGGINQMIMGEQGNLWQFIYAYTVEQQSSPTITWWNKNIPTHMICPDGYILLRKDRSDLRAGGGVAIICRKIP